MIAAAGFINFLFLVDSPEDVNLELPDSSSKENICNIVSVESYFWIYLYDKWQYSSYFSLS